MVGAAAGVHDILCAEREDELVIVVEVSVGEKNYIVAYARESREKRRMGE